MCPSHAFFCHTRHVWPLPGVPDNLSSASEAGPGLDLPLPGPGRPHGVPTLVALRHAGVREWRVGHDRGPCGVPGFGGEYL